MNKDLDARIKEEEKKIEPRFIERVRIENHYTKVEIPDNSNLLRLSKGYIKFYIGEEPKSSRNGWYKIPKGLNYVYYPCYRENSGCHGEPEFE